MAGRGPTAQDHRQRARDEKGFDTLPAEGYTGPFPKLPPTWRQEISYFEKHVTTSKDDAGKAVRTVAMVPVLKVVNVRYLKATRDWYETFARSPMATRFTDVDWRRLQEIAPLKDQYNRSPDTKLAAEIRLQETRLGATVRDRHEMRMRVASEAAAEGRGAAPVSSMAAARRARLRSVPNADE